MEQSNQTATATAVTKDRAYFSTQIRLRWNKARESILEVGGLLIEARRSLARDEYQKFIKVDLPFNYSTLQKLKVLAESDRINDPKNKDLLPHSWNTLYEIVHLSDEAFEAGIDRGIIHPDATWKEIKALRDEFDPELQAKRRTKAAAKLYGGTVIPLRTHPTRPQTKSQSASTPATPMPDAALVAPECESGNSSEAGTAEAIGSAVTSAAPLPKPTSEAPSSASIPVLNRIVAYLTDKVTDDQRKAVLADLRALKAKYSFIDSVQITVVDRA
jgi:hypothetical protein